MYIVPNTLLPISDELSHHGVLGMKWGIRRYQPYPKGHTGGKEVGEAARSAKSIQKDLKNIEKEYGKASYEVKNAYQRMQLIAKDSAKKEMKGKLSEKADKKQRSRFEEQRLRYNSNMKTVLATEQKITNLIKEAAANNYSVYNKPIRKVVNYNMKAKIANFLVGPGSSTIWALKANKGKADTPQAVSVNKWKVKNKGFENSHLMTNQNGVMTKTDPNEWLKKNSHK